MYLESLYDRIVRIRSASAQICKPLEIEDYSVQPALEVSPPKWHLAHTTWFWEQFVLSPYAVGYKVFNADFSFYFNSYYNNVGKRVLRPNRGLMTRPTVTEVYDYRQYVTEHLLQFIKTTPSPEILVIIEIGINHEEQHQELLAYDIKYILGHQPTFASFQHDFQLHEQPTDNAFIDIEAGIYNIGYTGQGFCFDNELGHHKVYLQACQIAKNVVTNAEYIEFMNHGGYTNFNLWHADGWDFINHNDIKSPMYWYKIEDEWHYYHFNGLEKVKPNLPVMHLSFYEAYAFAEWKGMRLPTEFEWEVASSALNFGQVWEWTNSAYLPYPNFTKAPGALGEYNGKFMVNQHVLRGASIATPQHHSRNTYRNFFQPNLRWLFCGLRLAI
jgi:ergothioneine biosynthesis protein EgtB